MRILSLVTASLLLWGATARASDEPVTGAKELFYDPAGGSISAGPPAKSQPKRSSGHASVAPVRSSANSPGRRSVQRAASPGCQKVLGLSYWIELADPKGGLETQVTDRRTFRSGEGIRLHFRSNADGRIALLQLGSSGDASLLFPDPEHGLGDADLAADQDRVLPSESRWFRFDDHPGTERLLVLFARDREDLETLSLRPVMDSKTTQAVLKMAGGLRGSKDLIIETETQSASEVGTYGVTLSGKPVILEITLKHE
jgi:hypothetical protein